MPNYTISREGDSVNVKCDSLVQATYDYQCYHCGSRSELTIEWPENLTTTSEISISGVSCPCCHSPVKLRRGKYHVEDFKLIFEPVAELDRSLS